MADSTELLPPSLRGKLIGSEKTTAGIVGVGILGALGYGAYLALPFIATLMSSLLSISLSALGVTAVAFVLLNRGMRSNFTLGFAVLNRKIHNLIVQRAPYDTVNYIIDSMQKSVVDGQARLARLRGANSRLSTQIGKNDDTIQQRIGLAKAAERLGQGQRKDAQLRMLGSTDAANKRLKAQLDMQQKLTDMLQRGIESAQLKVEEQREAVRLEIETNSVLTDGKEAAEDVLVAINGNPEKKALFDESMTAIAQDSALKYGQIQQVMIDLNPILNDIELGKIVDADHGQRVLDTFGETVEQIGQAPAKKVFAIEAPRA